MSLAETSGVPVGTIRDYEQGRRQPTVDQALKLARALRVSLNTLAGDEPPPATKRTKGRKR
jgi:transcriptional regulator with XRE-family HTH domain